MTRQAFIGKYGLISYLGPDGEIDTRSVIWLATSNLSDIQQLLSFEKEVSTDYAKGCSGLAKIRIDNVKEFLFDWNRVLKADERAAYAEIEHDNLKLSREMGF